MFILKIIQHYPLVCTIIIVTVWINYRCRKTRQNTDTANASLWARESKANSTRRKNIDNLDYITIDEKISRISEYFEIFLGRMTLCRRAAGYFGMQFEVNINGSTVM